ncbi:uncharacterized protein mymx [Aplochiton taeniatus]
MAPEVQTRTLSPKKDLLRTESQAHTQTDCSTVVGLQSDCFSQLNCLFNKEILQAEAWIKGKLQDLRDGCNVQRCPLQDWEEVSQTLQRDLKDYENTLIQLNQMGEQLICKLNPTADLVKKQLSQLRDQWHTLKQTADNQSRALGEAKNLQEFYKKVDKLETWIKEKQEEEQSLMNVLRENVDKMQLTRRILDLKQDEQLYRSLHEDINHFALKLEKQGRTEGKNISTRRKHINKMWLKFQSHLKDYHENLQLALEVSSFYQQSDNTLFAINSVNKSISEAKDLETDVDKEIRDIASQIMVLDVTVSQLSNLHPALAAGVTQKQSEVKDSWTCLQKAVSADKPGSPCWFPFRGDRAMLPPAASTFTREAGDPLTPAGAPLCSVGIVAHRIMGKEVKEEQNRLKGFSSIREVGSSRRTLISHSERQQSASLAPLGVYAGHPHDVIAGLQMEGESRRPRAKPKTVAAAPLGHPQLHVQLQKFTVSADKTLSWLKDNVAMATQVCSMAGAEGLEAARQCQDALEQEILTNRTRIEVVKKEGRGLVLAQHPGSVKIQEFLGQLEGLWEELRRRHQRNAVFLQASEELGFRAVKLWQALGSLEAWLESVELSMRESSLAGDPETMSVAERESCLLEREVSARGLELSALRQEVERLSGHSHPHTQRLPARMEEVERKYHRVQSALTQQNSELQDTRMLTEFLERVELEESQELRESPYGNLRQPLRGVDSSMTPALLGLQGDRDVAPLMESMGDPVEVLREAVEMLNDTVRERGRSQSHDQAITELLSRHVSLAVRVEECLSCSRELGVDILEREADMAVKCEPDRCGLEALQEQQDRLEIGYELIREEVEEMEKQASQLEELCPERVHTLRPEVQATLEAWAELGKSVAENHRQLRQFIQLQDFFRSYLAMISWTEDTRSCIFSDTALRLGRDGQEPMAAELDLQIEQKFEEFDQLAAAGRKLLDTEHHLAEMVRERMEELRSMLGWILVHWRAQKQQWLLRRKDDDPSQDSIYSEATLYLSMSETPPEPQTQQSPPMRALSDQQPGQTAGVDELEDEELSEDGYEVMGCVGACGGDIPTPEGLKSPFLVLKEPSSTPALGGTVNLILSFGNTGDSHVQVLEAPPRMEVEEVTESVHRPTALQHSACKSFWRRCQGLLENTLGSLKRKKKIYRQSADEVSTYLHVKENNLAVTPVYESITLPRLKTRSTASASISTSSSPSSCSSSSSSGSAAQGSSISFQSLHRSSNSSVFSSLKRMGKKRKRKRDARRHTIQRIMGVEHQTEVASLSEQEPLMYDTHTWPLKEARRKKSPPKSSAKGAGVEIMDYMKNPLLRDIEAECAEEYTITPYAVSEGAAAPAPAPSDQVRAHCRLLSLGSVLSFDLPKDMSLIPSIQDVITIGPPEYRRGMGAHATACTERSTALSSFKQARSPPSHRPRPSLEQSSSATDRQTGPRPLILEDLPDGDEAFPLPPPPALDEDEDQTVPCDDPSNIRFHSSDSGDFHQQAEQEWAKMVKELHSCTAGIWRTAKPEEFKNSPALKDQMHNPPTVTQHASECLSVHTLIQDLNGHLYHKGPDQSAPRESPDLQLSQCVNQASHMVVNLKSSVSLTVREDSVDSGISSSGSYKPCSEAPHFGTAEEPQPRGVVERLMSLEVGAADCTKTTEAVTPASSPGPGPMEPEPEPIHPDHHQFEEEEEELEDIWNHANGYRQSICSDIMYQHHQEEASTPRKQPREPPSPSASSKAQAMLYRKLVTASAPNLLVAEFRLPSPIQSLLGYTKEQSPGSNLLLLAKRDRRSWAAFSDKEPPSKLSTLVNETAADPVKLPEIEDHQRYIYQYKEEEEVEEEAEDGKEVEEDAGSPQDQSISLLSVNIGLDGTRQHGMASDSLDCMEVQWQTVATQGCPNTMSGTRPELQSMAGTLERKNKLQLGGKKAPSRAWNSYHAVLYRQTLCFYQDRKETLRSSVCGLPLNLIGAECASAPDYTKKANCFSLRLRDGSEYLFSASSRFIMKKWMLKIQANTGFSESVPSIPVQNDLPATS